jgi:hypothetical protein
LFKGQFSASTPCVLVNDVRILKPTLILDAKCGSILGRASMTKKQTDAFDIKFLLAYIARYGIPVGLEVPNATGEFITLFVGLYGGRELFQKAGFTIPGGMFPFSEHLTVRTPSLSIYALSIIPSSFPRKLTWNNGQITQLYPGQARRRPPRRQALTLHSQQLLAHKTRVGYWIRLEIITTVTSTARRNGHHNSSSSSL